MLNFKTGKVIAENKRWPIKENKIITPILTKLLATRRVANNFLGFSNSLEIIIPFDGYSCKVSSISFCDNEKKATSAPEINAEQKSNTKMARKPNTKLVSKADAKRKLGSGSKLK